MKTENTTYEDMKEAFTEHTGVVLDVDPSEDVPLEGVKIISNRTEKGALVDAPVAEEAAPEVAAVAAPVEEASAAEEPAAGTWDHTRPPSSWTPKAREDWKLIPEHLQKEITRREENAMMGARNLQEKYGPIQLFAEELRESVNEAISSGVTRPVDHINSLMAVERTLRTAPMPEKFDTLMAMADQFGIPLRQIVNASVGQEVLKAPQAAQSAIPQELQYEIQAMREWRESQEQYQINTEVEQLSSQLEVFGDVRLQMAELIERGMAADIHGAYEQAIWMNPEVREVLLSRTAAPPQNAVKARQVKAVGASIKPSGAIEVDIDTGEDDSIEDTLRKAFNASQGRI